VLPNRLRVERRELTMPENRFGPNAASGIHISLYAAASGMCNEWATFVPGTNVPKSRKGAIFSALEERL
jgi:hypothetical protein